MALRRRGGRDDGDQHLHFKMREQMMSIGDDYWIENDRGQRAYHVDGKALRLRDTWRMEDASGHEVATIKERKLAVRDTISIDLGGRDVKVKKAMIGIRDRFHVEVENGVDLDVKGNIVDHEYEIERDGHTIAEVSKKWFRLRDTYGVEVNDPSDEALVLSITVAVDALSHQVG